MTRLCDEVVLIGVSLGCSAENGILVIYFE